MDTKITSAIWSNVGLELVGPEAKLAALWLLTNEHIDIMGYAELSERRFIFETGLEAKALPRAYEGLGNGLVLTGKGYWLRNYIGYQYGRGLSLVKNNWSKGLTKRLNGGCDEALGRLVLGEYPELLEVEGFISPWKGLKGLTKPKRGEERKGKEGKGSGIGPAEIYAAYPRRVGKQDALRAIAKQLAGGTKAEYLLERVQAYAAAVAAWPASERGFVPYPATWFNAGRQDDDPAQWVRKPANGHVSEKLPIVAGGGVSMTEADMVAKGMGE